MNEDNVKNQLERSHKGMKDVQTKRRYTIHKHIYDHGLLYSYGPISPIPTSDTRGQLIDVNE